MKVPKGSCKSAIGAEQLPFLYGDVANRRHIRLKSKNITGKKKNNYSAKINTNLQLFS